MHVNLPPTDTISYLRRHTPDEAVMFFCPAQLRASAAAFQSGFPGLVSYAVKANPALVVLANLVAAGVRVFDVASPNEMRAVRDVCPTGVLHYNNPVRSPREVAEAIRLGVASYSVDCMTELDKLKDVPKGTEVAVRLALGIKGGLYDFGTKFGATPEAAGILLQAVAERGFNPSVTFHPGTQCSDPAAWEGYIDAAAAVARASGVALARLNVGGGFAAQRDLRAPDLGAVFSRIDRARTRAFGADRPALLCEPGRAMVAECFTLATRVKALRPDGSVFLNDGIYGALGEMRDIETPRRLRVISASGAERRGPRKRRVIFGPTCDSVDRLPGTVPLAASICEGDYLLFDGMGAYSLALASRFNGYGVGQVVTVGRL